MSRKNHSTFRVWYYPQFQAPIGVWNVTSSPTNPPPKKEVYYIWPLPSQDNECDSHKRVPLQKKVLVIHLHPLFGTPATAEEKKVLEGPQKGNIPDDDSEDAGPLTFLWRLILVVSVIPKQNTPVITLVLYFLSIIL